MSGSKIDVGYVAELARLELSAEEKALFQQQKELQTVLCMVRVKIQFGFSRVF